MPTLMFFGREFETSIDTGEMTGKEFRDFMDEVIRCGLRVMENRQSAQSQRCVNMDWFEYVTPESIRDSDKRIWMTSWEDWIPMLKAYDSLMNDIKGTYEQMVEAGIPEEDARYVLPNAYTAKIVVKTDGFDYVIPESIRNHEKTWDEDGKTDIEKWYRNTMEGLSEFYAELIDAGIPEEDARYVLPIACTTNIDKKVKE